MFWHFFVLQKKGLFPAVPPSTGREDPGWGCKCFRDRAMILVGGDAP